MAQPSMMIIFSYELAYRRFYLTIVPEGIAKIFTLFAQSTSIKPLFLIGDLLSLTSTILYHDLPEKIDFATSSLILILLAILTLTSDRPLMVSHL